MGVGGQYHALAVLPPGKTRYPLYRRLGGPQGLSGRVQKTSPPAGIRSPDRPACSDVQELKWHIPGSTSYSVEEDIKQSRPYQWTLPMLPPYSVIHTYTEHRWARDSEVPHTNNSSPSLSVFSSQFMEIVSQQVVETDRNYHSYSDAVDKGLSAVADLSETIMFVFLPITTQICYFLWDQLIDCWATVNLFYRPFHGNVMKRNLPM